MQESKYQVKSLRQGNTKILEKRKLQMNSSFNVEFAYCNFTIKALEGFMKVIWDLTTNNSNTAIAKYLKKQSTMKLCQLVEYNVRNIFLKNHIWNDVRRQFPYPFIKDQKKNISGWTVRNVTQFAYIASSSEVLYQN